MNGMLWILEMPVVLLLWSELNFLWKYADKPSVKQISFSDLQYHAFISSVDNALVFLSDLQYHAFISSVDNALIFL